LQKVFVVRALLVVASGLLDVSWLDVLEAMCGPYYSRKQKRVNTEFCNSFDPKTAPI